MGRTEHLAEAAPDPFVASAGVEHRRQREVENVLGWPITRLGAWSLTLLLAASILGPALASAQGESRLSLIVVSSALVTFAARALFGWLGRALRVMGATGRTVAVVAAALAAAGAMSALCALLGLPRPALIDAITAVAVGLTLVLACVLRGVEARHQLGLGRVYIVGLESSQHDLERELILRKDARVVGKATVGAGRRSIEGTALEAAIRDTGASALVLDSAAMLLPELVRITSWLRMSGVRSWDLVSYYEHQFKKLPLAELSPSWLALDATLKRRRRLQEGLRRAIDGSIAGAVLLLLSVPLLAAAIMVRFTSPGPALYRQRRVGKDGLPFTLLKLRTMSQSVDGEAAWAVSQAHRVTRIGRHLRRFRLDELPQLWNVIRGDLALIGPRPEQVAIARRLEEELPNYSARHCIRPGITGWAQVHLGYAGSMEGTAAKLQRDLYYVKRRSLRLDLLIAWLTLKIVIEGRE